MSKIIIVEDNLAYLTAIRRILEKAGHEVVVVNDFSSLDLCAEKIIYSGAEVVFLDHFLGANFTGEDILRKLKIADCDARIVSTTTDDDMNYCPEKFSLKAELVYKPKDERAPEDLLRFTK